MNILRKASGLLSLAFALLALPAMVSAQQTIKCESNDGHRKYCGNVDPNRVVMQQQISGSPCDRDRTWGVDRQGLWVDRGCRAIFEIRRGGPGGPGYGEGGPGHGEGGPHWIHPGPDNDWPPRGNWNGGNWGRGGACFYTEYNFGGDYFCMRRGEAFPSLSDYGDRISSMRVFGGARVTVYNDRNYSNGQDRTKHDFSDLREWRMSQDRSHTWNNRISSVRVE